jgi:hypothetical protein
MLRYERRRKMNKVILTKHVIDCDAYPFLPDGWKVEEHQKSGQLEWDPAKVALYLSPKQQNGKVIEGHKLRKELKGKPVLNANVLDFLLAHPELIPDEWKGETVFFWGTIYRGSGGALYVRCLSWNVGQWYWHSRWLENDWHDNNPAALLASSS